MKKKIIRIKYPVLVQVLFHGNMWAGTKTGILTHGFTNALPKKTHSNLIKI